MDELLIVRSDPASVYDLGAAHPMSPTTRSLGVELARALGVLDAPGVREITASPATDAVIERVHAAAYVAAVRRYSETPILAAAPESGTWGLHPSGDTPAFAGMHAAAAAVCGASVEAALAVQSGRARRSFAPSGGLHHALANRAAGFCIYNDPAVAIQALLDAGVERVAYIDVDVHHGDGVQWIFYEDPRVLTCSVHESGRTLFPGTGSLAERGVGPATGTAVNIPLPAFSGSTPYLRAFDEIIAPAVEAFAPDVIVTQNGVDPHHADPLAHLCVTLGTFPELWRRISELATARASGRLVALGGGGYNPDVVPRAFALLIAELAGVDAPDAIPAEWVARASEAFGFEVTQTLRADTHLRHPSSSAQRPTIRRTGSLPMLR